MNSYIFVIDTNSYAGNFERDMTAYMTGIVGECGVGKEYAEIFDKEVPPVDGERLFDEYIDWRPDDRGVLRPSGCWPTKGWLRLNQEKAVRKEDWNQAEADAAYQKEMSDIYREYLRNFERVHASESGWSQESIDHKRGKMQEDIDAAMNAKAPMIEPNNSVAIFFNQQPTKEMVATMKDRAERFAAAKRNNAKLLGYDWKLDFSLVIHGYRLIMETVSRTEIETWQR